MDVINLATVRAKGTIGPTLSFEILAGLIFVAENRIGEVNRHGTPYLEIVDILRDDTFTVLFQKNGIRYAVVTLPENETWLTDILTTWQFTD